MATIREPVQDVGFPPPATYPTGVSGQAVKHVDRDGHPSRDFDAILRSVRKRATRRSVVGQENDDGDSRSPTAFLALSLAGFRAEPPRDANGPADVRLPVRITSDQRVLVGSGSSNGHARIQFSGGNLAGCEIRLALVGANIDAELLTRNEGSRQTLVAAMDAVRGRLRARGLELRTAATQGSVWDGRDPNTERRQPASHRVECEKA